MYKRLPIRYALLVAIPIASTILAISGATAQTESITQTPQRAAEFDQRYQTYRAVFDQYRQKHAEYVKARTNFFTYGTLRSETDLIDVTKELLLLRNDVLVAYVDALFARNIDPDFDEVLFDEKTFLQANKAKIPEIATLSDIDRISREIENHQPVLESIAHQVAGSILLARVDRLEVRVNQFDQDLKVYISQLQTAGNDTSTLERWMVISQNRIFLARQNLTDARSKIISLFASDEVLKSYNTARQSLFVTNQYLKESIDQYNELLREVKYGNYQ